MRALYERPVEKGKLKGQAAARPVALVACMCKLLVTCNAVVRDGAAWEPNRVLAA